MRQRIAGAVVENVAVGHGDSNISDWGGAVYLRGEEEDDTFERVHLIRCLFDENTANATGGAVYVENKDVTISHSRFEQNTAEDSAWALWFGGNRTNDESGEFSAYVICNLFGPGNDVVQTSTPAARSVAYVFQHADSSQVTMLFTNNTVAGNTALRGVTLDNNQSGSDKLVFSCFNSIIYGNSTSLTDVSIHNPAPTAQLTITYTDTEQGITGTGNISSDPEFLGATNFRLDGSVPSPCIDAGSNFYWMPGALDSNIPNTDLAGVTRIQNSTIDMGCYED